MKIFHMVVCLTAITTGAAECLGPSCPLPVARAPQTPKEDSDVSMPVATIDDSRMRDHEVTLQKRYNAHDLSWAVGYLASGIGYVNFYDSNDYSDEYVRG
jgi:hypothetical protein